MGRRKIEIKAIKDDRNRSVYVFFFALPSPLDAEGLTLIRQYFPQTKRRPIQESTRTLCPLFGRCCCHNLRSQQETVRILVRRHQRDSGAVSICKKFHCI